jgi:hypothetical protein
VTAPGPFAALGLPATPMLTDEDVRAAWRAIAAATHPDREDGGHPEAYRQASAAYAILRSPWGRTEAYADLPPAARQPPAPVPVPAGPAAAPPPVPVTVPAPGTARPRGPLPGVRSLPGRVRYGRPARLAARVAAAAAVAAAAWWSGAGMPAVAGVLAAIVTWLVLTARGDLAPPPGR